MLKFLITVKLNYIFLDVITFKSRMLSVCKSNFTKLVNKNALRDKLMYVQSRAN